MRGRASVDPVRLSASLARLACMELREFRLELEAEMRG